MNNTYDYDATETEIDLIDLMKELIRHWKSIMLITLIAMVIAAGVSALRSAGEVSEQDIAEQEADIRTGYELLKLQYENDMKVYNMRESTYEEYNEAVDMLTEELERLKSIPESDKEGRLTSLVTISSLQGVVNNANSMRTYYKDLEKPEKIASFESYKAEQLKEAGVNLGLGGISIKYLVIGLFVGGFLGCFIWGMVYLLDGKIKTGSELARCYGVNLLGSPDKTGLVAANVRNFIPEGTSSLLVTGSIAEEDLKKVSEAIKATTGIDKIETAAGLNRNADTALLLSGTDAVVLVERLKKTKLADLVEEISMIRNAGKELIGVAV